MPKATHIEDVSGLKFGVQAGKPSSLKACQFLPEGSERSLSLCHSCSILEVGAGRAEALSTFCELVGQQLPLSGFVAEPGPRDDVVSFFDVC